MVIGVIVGLFGIVLALSTGLVWGTIRHQALVKEHGILEATNQQLTTQLATQKSDLMQLANRLFDEKTNRFSQDNQQSLNTLLAPFKTALSEFKTTLDQTQRHEADQRAALKGELSQLVTLNQTMAQEARQLSNALKGNTKTQGNWGELILETVLEQSGLEKGREFIVQTGLKTDTGERQQPDVILKLPGDRHIIIDSKVSLNAYELYTQTPDPHPLKLHIQAIRNHIKTLSEKNYPA
ncbi:MAG: DNA recombination protein RmuC, partial [bacterium]|nr:DNA recombination protein RmuC [bacterium]